MYAFRLYHVQLSWKVRNNRPITSFLASSPQICSQSSQCCLSSPGQPHLATSTSDPFYTTHFIYPQLRSHDSFRRFWVDNVRAKCHSVVALLLLLFYHHLHAAWCLLCLLHFSALLPQPDSHEPIRLTFPPGVLRRPPGFLLFLNKQLNQPSIPPIADHHYKPRSSTWCPTRHTSCASPCFKTRASKTKRRPTSWRTFSRRRPPWSADL